MTKASGFLTSLTFIISATVCGQSKTIKAKEFFEDDRVINMSLSVDIKNLLAAKKDTTYVPASVSVAFPDSSTVNENIRMRPKGIFRRQNCYLASLQLDFKNPTSPVLSPLKKLKLIGGCGKNSGDEQLLLKEYLVYKLYNLFTDMSFRVRLANVTYKDTREKAKPYTQYAFFIEDIDELAKRNECKEKKNGVQTQQTNRKQMTLVAFFQFMVGNTDWSVPTLHNIKLITAKKDSIPVPYVIPHDFDYTGFVNASYAIPPEMFETTKITERVYRGFPRTPEEIDEMRNIFLAKEAQVKSLIADFKLLNNGEKKEALDYIDEFYSIAKNKKRCETEFIEKARTQ
ncbi:MAG: hypothetical protein ABUT20_20980 [Bacteroidota bacterium]